MKETALFVGWGGAFPGRELVALDGYHEWVEILEELKEKGEIEDFITVALSPTGSELDGFTLVFADEMTLMQLSRRSCSTTTWPSSRSATTAATRAIAVFSSTG